MFDGAQHDSTLAVEEALVASDLRVAVLAKAKAEFRTKMRAASGEHPGLMGDESIDAHIAYLRRVCGESATSGKPSHTERRALDLIARLQSVLLKIDGFASTPEGEVVGELAATWLRELATKRGFRVALAESRAFSDAGLSRRGRPPKWSIRRAVIYYFDRTGRFWWFDRKPNIRELAILSLLAGSFPDGYAPTVGKVIQREADAMRLARGKHT
jgi:hypothetical protein